MKKGKIIGMLSVFLVGMFVMSALAIAGANIEEVKIDGTTIDEGENALLDVQRGDDIEIKVKIEGTAGGEDGVQLEAFIRGYDHDDLIEDITDVFDVKDNRIYTKTLTLTIPDNIDLDDGDDYTLVIIATGREGLKTELQRNVVIGVSSERHDMTIKDVVLSPEGTVVAGRALLATVRVKNVGEKDEDGIKVRVSVPELGISASDYIDELDAEDSTTSEELYLRIPTDATSGDYDVKVEVIFDDGDETTTQTTVITVKGEDKKSTSGKTGPETVLTIGAEAQDVMAGEGGVVYPITITNNADNSKTFVVDVDGVDAFGASRVSPSNAVIIGSGQTETVYVYVSAAEDAEAGENMFSITIKADSETLKQIPLKATVVADDDATGFGGIRKGLEVGLVILVILLVIIGLIIGFNKLKGEDDEGDDSSQTYY